METSKKQSVAPRKSWWAELGILPYLAIPLILLLIWGGTKLWNWLGWYSLLILTILIVLIALGVILSNVKNSDIATPAKASERKSFSLPTWSKLLIGIIAIVILVWIFLPNLKSYYFKSKNWVSENTQADQFSDDVIEFNVPHLYKKGVWYKCPFNPLPNTHINWTYTKPINAQPENKEFSGVWYLRVTNEDDTVTVMVME